MTAITSTFSGFGHTITGTIGNQPKSSPKGDDARPAMESGGGAAMSPGHARTSSNGVPPLKKIIALVGVALLLFLAISSYQLVKSIESRASLRNVEQMYFPVLIKADSSVAIMDKVSEEYLKAVMAAAADKAVSAHALGAEAVQNLEQMARLFPEKAKAINQIRAQFASYNEEAARMDDDYLNHKIVLREWLPRMQEMNATLATTRDTLKALRASCYEEFTRTLEGTKSAMQWNLYLGLALGSMNLCLMGVLVYFIRNNLRMMALIADQNANLEKRVTERTLALRQKTADIQSMLQNMPQGVLTITAGNKIHPEYSAYLESIFETTDIAGRDLMDLVFSRASLGADTLSTIDVSIASCIGEDAMNYEFNSHLLVTEFQVRMEDGRTKSLELSWSPIVNDSDTVEKLMVCVRDVTEFKRLANEASTQKRELEMIGEILLVSQEKFQDFMQTSMAFVDESRALTEQASGPAAELMTQLFRNMHTVKGNARTYGLGHLTNTVHEAEQTYDELRRGQVTTWEPAALLGQLDAVRRLLDEYAKLNDTKLGRKGPGRRGNVEKFLMVDKRQVAQTLHAVQSVDMDDVDAMRAALLETRALLNRLGAERIQDLLAGVTDSLPSLAKELGKEPPLVTIHDRGVLVRNQIGGLLKNLFTHLLRNAVDHGLESPSEREASGKPAAGRIDLDIALSGDGLTLVVSDDGRGMALDRIRHIADARGLTASSTTLTDEETAQLVFLAGFSTAQTVTEISGRGVGLDAVKGFLEREGGRVSVRFLGPRTAEGYRPFEFVIALPSSFAVAG
ncbi:MAG: ATP-binding protein [Pseudomonadota bacterium]|nr:ATP-binding protein [Pseudomonadota bacterium]